MGQNDTLLKEIVHEYGNDEKCQIGEPEKVERILEGLITGGSTKLQVITDFDFTLTRFHKNGERCTSCHGIVDHISEEYHSKAEVLFKKYYPIEIDHEMSTEEKIPHMINWYRKAEHLLIQHRLSRSIIEEMVGRGGVELRDTARDVLSQLHAQEVPCLVFSAGLGDVLEAVLQRENAYFPNMKVVSNFFAFDERGRCLSYKEPLIHMFNKNESALLQSNAHYFQGLSDRRNALVLGDSLGDVHMDKGLHNAEAVLKIGFLNDKITERLESFKENFDVVLIDDQSFRFVQIVLNKIFSK